jgi:hypothetical protein
MALSKFFPLSWIISKERDLPSCIKTEPIPWPRASDSTINVFLKLGVVTSPSLRLQATQVSDFFFFVEA